MKLSNHAKQIRSRILGISFAARTGHIGSCMSMVEILTYLHFKFLRFEQNIENEKGKGPHIPQLISPDALILSKGHGGAALYSTMVERGIFDSELLKMYCKDGSVFGGHVDANAPGVEFSTGSLGHGLSLGVGITLANKMNNSDAKTVVIVSDGECNEGSTWEAAMAAYHHGLDNLYCFVDCNKWQAFGKTDDVLKSGSLQKKFESFGFDSVDIDGHSYEQIQRAMLRPSRGVPRMIIGNTIKGKGIPFMEDTLRWHYKSMSEDEYAESLKQLYEVDEHERCIS